MLPIMRTDATSVSDVADRLPTPGIGSRREWSTAGATDRMFKDGRLRRVARNVYVPAATPDADLPRLLAARLPEAAVLGGWAAAVLHGVRDAGPDMPGASGQNALAYRSRHDHKQVPGFDVLRCDLLPDEVTVVGGIRTTCPARTAYDMARFSSGLPEAVAVADQFGWTTNAQPVRPADFVELAERRPRARGNPRVLLAAELMSPRARSAAESRLRVRWVRECAIAPASILVNPTLHFDGVELELDLVDLSSGLVGEYDGPHHARPEQQPRRAQEQLGRRARAADAALQLSGAAARSGRFRAIRRRTPTARDRSWGGRCGEPARGYRRPPRAPVARHHLTAASRFEPAVLTGSILRDYRPRKHRRFPDRPRIHRRSRRATSQGG